MVYNGNDKLILRERINKMLQKDMTTRHILYWHAHTGWGKTTAIRQYFSCMKLSYTSLNAADEVFIKKFRKAVRNGEMHILVDDLHRLDERNTEEFYELLDKAPKSIRIYLLGRAWMPSYLKKYEITNELVSYDYKRLAFEEEEAQELLKCYEISCKPKLLEKIVELSNGWIVLIVLLAKRSKDGSTLDSKAIELAKMDLFDFFDYHLWNVWDSDVINFLLNMAHLQSFTEQEAGIVCSKSDVRKVIQHIMSISSFMIRDDETTYHFQKPFGLYLQKKQRELYDEKTIKLRYENTALYFSMQNDLPNAMKYYKLAGDQQKITEILIENANSFLGDAYYYELEKYYLDLDEASIRQSPEMLKAMAMMHSISLRVEESNGYVELLKELEQSLPSSDPRKRTAKNALAYLQITLPHQGSGHFMEKLISLSRVKQGLLQINITGDMPSAMNGGLDFCDWSKNDRKLYQRLKTPMEIVFGKEAKGMAEIALGESLYEKNVDGDLMESLMLLNSGRTSAEISGNLQMQFAANAVIARIFLSEGNLMNAQDILFRFHEKVSQTGKRQLPHNTEAFLIWMHMLAGEDEVADAWLAERAPNENEHFIILERYRYMIKVKIYIMKRMYLEAVSLLDRLEHYFSIYERKYNLAEVKLLRAIVLYRAENDLWMNTLAEAIDFIYDYRFVRIFADLGVSILPLLKEYRKRCSITRSNDTGFLEYLKLILKAVSKQADYYPSYLEPKEQFTVVLTKTEKLVLKEVSLGLSNQEIGDKLCISVATVKTHIQNIYSKLEVKNRITAVQVAAELKLI